MPDDLDHDLERLAPSIDTEHAGAAFRRGRRRARAFRRGGRAAAAVSILIVGTVAALVISDPGEPQLRTGPSNPSADGGPIEFDVLAVGEGSDTPMGTLRAATNEEEYDGLWSASGATGARPIPNFGKAVVVSITIPDDACPPELTELTREGDVLTPVFVEPTTACVQPLIPKTFVVILQRAQLEPKFTLRLPGDPTFGFEEQRLDVELGPPSDPELTCAAIERFAERITDVGISYDYDASASPEELMATVDMVVVGSLTGQVASVAEDGSTAAVGYEVDVGVGDVLKGRPVTGARYVWLDVNPSIGMSEFEDVVKAGIPVVVFAYDSDRRPGYDTAIEGLATGCPGGPLLGRVGIEPGWTDIDTLDGLIARLEAAAGR